MSDTPRTDELRLRGHNEVVLLEYAALERELAASQESWARCEGRCRTHRQRITQLEAQVERMYELQAQHTEAEGMLAQERDRYKAENAALREAQAEVLYTGEAEMKVTKEMVDRFLTWPLPTSVLPDACVMDRLYPHRSGTNLLTADQARAMLEHVLGCDESSEGKENGR